MAKSNTKQAFWISFGSGCALVFTIVSAMVMSRYYDKSEYGTYKQIFWIYSTFTVVFTLGLPKAFGYFLPQVPMVEAQSLTDKITRIFFILGAFFSLILFLLSEQIAQILENPELATGLKLFSPIPFFLLPTMGLESIYATYQKTEIYSLYNIISKGNIALSLIVASILFPQSYVYAIIAFNISSFINFIVALYLKRRPFIGYKSTSTTVSYKAIFAFSIPLMATNIVNIIINSTDQFFISRFFGVDAFADYSNGAMELPFIGMIVGACSVVLLPAYSKIRQNENSTDATKDILVLWKSVINKTVMLIYPLITFCLFFSIEIMVVLYGTQYYQSGYIFFIMLFNNFFAVISTYPLILALNKVKQYFTVYLFNCLLLIGLEWFIVTLTPNVYLICLASVICLACRNLLFIKIISRSLNLKLRSLIPFKLILMVSLLSVSLLAAIKMILSTINISYFITLMIAGTVYGSSFFFISRKLKLDYISILKPIIKGK